MYKAEPGPRDYALSAAPQLAGHMAHHSAMARMEHQALLAAKRQVILEQVEGVGYWSSIQTNQCLPKPYGDLVQGIIAAQTLALLDNTHFALLIYNSASQRCIEGAPST